MTWILISITLLASVLLVSYLVYSIRLNAVEHWADLNRTYVMQQGAWIEDELNQAKERMQNLARQAAFLSPPDTALIHPQLNGIAPDVEPDRRKALDWLLDEDDHAFSVLFELLPNGDHYLSHPFSVQQTLKFYNLAHRAYFKKAVQTVEPVISDVFLGADGVRAVAIMVPVVNGSGTVSSYLGGVLHLSTLSRLFTHIRDRYTKEAVFLLDNKGALVGHRGGEALSDNVYADYPSINSFIRQQRSAATADDFYAASSVERSPVTGEMHSIMLVRLKSGWVIGKLTALDTVLARFNQGVWRIALLSILLLGLVSGLGILLVRRVGLHWQVAEKQVVDARAELEQRVSERTQELKFKQENLRATLDSIGDGVIAADVYGTIVEMNPVAEKLTGWRAEEAQGQLLGRVLHTTQIVAADDGYVATNDSFMRATSAVFSRQSKLIARDGRVLDIAECSAPIRNASGHTSGLIMVFRDITEESQVRRELEKSESRYRHLFEHADISIWNIDFSAVYTALQGVRQEGVNNLTDHLQENPDQLWKLVDLLQVIQINRATLKMFGTKPVDGFVYDFKNIVGQNANGTLLFTRLFNSLWERHENFQAEAELRTLDGRNIHAVITFHVGVTDDAMRNVPVIFREITLQKKSESTLREREERYRSAITTSHDGFLLVDLDGDILDVNEAYIRRSGYSREELLSMHVADLEAVEEKELVRQHIQLLIKSGYELFTSEHRTKSGDIWPVEISASYLDSDNGQACFFAFCRDITQRKLSEKALYRVQKMEALGQLTGGIAHDFNNILSILSGNLALLAPRLNADQESSRRVVMMNKSVRRAADLTRQLLGFSRKQSMGDAVANVNELIKLMAQMLTRVVTPEITLTQHLYPQLWPVLVDRGDFEDALINLILNARDAMSQGGTLSIETANRTLDVAFCQNKPDAQPGDYIELAVVDDGEGMTEQQQEHIFEPFYTTKPEGEGTGLGLARVFGFAKRSRGFITVQSQPEQGARFNLYLPRIKGAKVPLPQQDEQQQQLLPGGSETLLVVDDEADLLELAKETLELQGYHVLTAANGQQALALLEREPAIALLFSDVVMPGGINGFQLASSAIASHPRIKVLLTSGYSDKAAQHGAQLDISYPLLDKPYDHETLLSRVRALLDDPATQRVGRKERKSSPVQSTFRPNEWSQALSVGVDALDQDHQKLLALLNRSHQAIEQQLDNVSMDAILDELLYYTRFHFGREEKVMEVCGYPGLNSHRQVHNLLLRRVEKIRIQSSRGEWVGEELFTLLNTWLLDHVGGMDNAYMPYCEGKMEQIARALDAMESEAGHKSAPDE